MGMSKEELIEAINGTLISNEEKAITADALRNLLTDIVENSGSGDGSSGGGGISLFAHFKEETNEDGEQIITSLLTSEQIAHNKEQMEILTQLHEEGKPIPPISFDVPNEVFAYGASGFLSVCYMTLVYWSIDDLGEEVPEGMPIPIFPTMMSYPGGFVIQGDGTFYLG